MPKFSDSAYRVAAMRHLHAINKYDEGDAIPFTIHVDDCTVDELVRPSEGGANVLAWIWVSDEDAKKIEEE